MYGWSSAKMKSWCCEQSGRGCPGTWRGGGLAKAVVTHVSQRVASGPTAVYQHWGHDHADGFAGGYHSYHDYNGYDRYHGYDSYHDDGDYRDYHGYHGFLGDHRQFGARRQIYGPDREFHAEPWAD
ncbi:unnamed protein product [Effrenium voratum]|nr:unnamed protein product [Effrenium voratum]